MRPGPIFLGLCLIAAWPSPVPAQSSFRTTNWTGGAYFSGQQFTHCAIGRAYPDGLNLVIQMSPQLQMTVGGSKSDWNLQPGSQWEMTFEIDGGYKKTFQGRVNANQRNTIWFAVGNDPDFRRALAGNGTLTWVDPKNLRFPFSLANADNALRKLLACTALYGVD